MVIALMLACADEPVDIDEGFRVIGVVPEDGAADAVEAQVPELRFSELADEATCGPEALRLDAIHEDWTVAFPVEVSLTAVDRGAKIQFTHTLPLEAGWTYAVTVRGGEEGCTDTHGTPVRPFASSFTVP